MPMSIHTNTQHALPIYIDTLKESKGKGRISRQRKLFEPYPFLLSFQDCNEWTNEQRMQ